MRTDDRNNGFRPNQPAGRFANYDTKACNASTDEALAEIERESNVRMKCYDRWVSEGKMTPDEAEKRMGGLVSAWHFIAGSDQGREVQLHEQRAKNERSNTH
jgi:polyhydroxyalkanoate synthesis regulator phasin